MNTLVFCDRSPSMRGRMDATNNQHFYNNPVSLGAMQVSCANEVLNANTVIVVAVFWLYYDEVGHASCLEA